jgi:hypothetical protein
MKNGRKYGSEVKRAKTSAKRSRMKNRKNPAWNKREALRTL